MTDDRAVIKEPVLTISTDMWVPSWRSKFPVQVHSQKFKSQYKFQVPSTSLRFIPKLRVNTKSQTEIKTPEMRRNELSRNDTYLQHRVSNNKYDNMIFHVDNHN